MIGIVISFLQQVATVSVGTIIAISSTLVAPAQANVVSSQGEAAPSCATISKKVLNKALGSGWKTGSCHEFPIMDPKGRLASFNMQNYYSSSTNQQKRVSVAKSTQVEEGMSIRKSMRTPSLGKTIKTIVNKPKFIVKEWSGYYSAIRKTGKNSFVIVQYAPSLKSVKLLSKAV